MDNNINQELNNTLAGLCNMVKTLSDQVQHLVTKFDTLEAANNQLKAELDHMRAVVKQLTTLNARPLSQPDKPFKATDKQPVIDILALNAPGTEASKHATATSSNPAAWITVAKRPAKPKYGVLTSERKRQATARAFNAPTPFSSPGYDYVYVHRSRRLNRSEIRQRFRKLGIDTSRILDISFPASGIIGLLVHKEFKLILVQTLEDCKVEIIASFNPCDAQHVADAKYNKLTGQDRVDLGYALNQLLPATMLSKSG
ncbi:hypothetical protein G6F42_022878 [Rhizopus arrhizus]|nr:hypothetical protein G6F42_022878 [Rhizopus arrhizus]